MNAVIPNRIVLSMFVLIFAGCHADLARLPQESTATENQTRNSTMKAANDMREYTDRIEKWLQTNAPDFLPLLNSPATLDDLSAFESRNDLVLPPEVRDLYLIYNGESEDSDGLFGCCKLLSLDEIEEEIELTGQEGSIPLFLSGGGDSYYVKSFDAANPDRKIYECWHEQPEDETVVAESLAQFLSDFCDKLHNGQYVRDPGRENPLKALVDRDDP